MAVVTKQRQPLQTAQLLDAKAHESVEATTVRHASKSRPTLGKFGVRLATDVLPKVVNKTAAFHIYGLAKKRDNLVVRVDSQGHKMPCREAVSFVAGMGLKLAVGGSECGALGVDHAGPDSMNVRCAHAFFCSHELLVTVAFAAFASPKVERDSGRTKAHDVLPELRIRRHGVRCLFWRKRDTTTPYQPPPERGWRRSCRPRHAQRRGHTCLSFQPLPWRLSLPLVRLERGGIFRQMPASIRGRRCRGGAPSPAVSRPSGR